MQNSHVKEEILEQIRLAFFNVKRPADSDLLWYPDTTPEVFIESFIGDWAKNWWEVADEKIELECHAYLRLASTRTDTTSPPI